MRPRRAGDLPADVVSPDFGHVPAGCEVLTAALSGERDLLDSLLCVLTAEQLMLESRNTRWLVRASARVGELVEQLQELDLVRSMAADEVLAELELAPTTTMLELATAIGEPIASIHRELHSVTRALVDEIDLATRRNEDLLLALVRPRRTPERGCER